MTLGPAIDVSAEAIAAIGERLGLRDPIATSLSSPGSANTIYTLNDAWILRVPRDHPAVIASVAIESTAVRAARSAGVRTPEIVLLDDSLTILPVPFAVYERVRGVPLQAVAGVAELDEPWFELGIDLARLHCGVDRSGPAGQIASADEADPEPWLAGLREHRLITSQDERWLRGWLDRLAPYARSFGDPRFCHGDVNAGNVIIGAQRHEYRAIIDWGGVVWTDPAWDFVPVTLRVVPAMLRGYRSIAPMAGDSTAEARILWNHLLLAIFGLRVGPKRDPGWIGARIDRLRMDVAEFAAWSGLADLLAKV